MFATKPWMLVTPMKATGVPLKCATCSRICGNEAMHGPHQVALPGRPFEVQFGGGLANEGGLGGLGFCGLVELSEDLIDAVGGLSAGEIVFE
jgi:hypothetical protein